MKSESNFKRLDSITREVSRTDDESFYSADEDEEPTNANSPLDANDVYQASYYKFQIKLKNVQVCLTENQRGFRQFTQSLRAAENPDEANSSSSSSQQAQNYVLTPLDLFFNLHHCVYADDVKLPGLKVFGGLPLISIEMTNKKLEQLIQIAASIPLPENSRTMHVESNFGNYAREVVCLLHFPIYDFFMS